MWTKWLVFFDGFFSLFCCQKLIYEFDFSFLGKTVVIPEFVFQIREMAIYHISGIGYVQLIIIIPCEQPLHIRFKTSMSAPESFMGKMAFARLNVDGALVQEVFPLYEPRWTCNKKVDN